MLLDFEVPLHSPFLRDQQNQLFEIDAFENDFAFHVGEENLDEGRETLDSLPELLFAGHVDKGVEDFECEDVD